MTSVGHLARAGRILACTCIASSEIPFFFSRYFRSSSGSNSIRQSNPASTYIIFSSIFSLRASISLAPFAVGSTVAALHAVSRYLNIFVRAPLCAHSDRSTCGFVFPSNRPLYVSEAVGSIVCVVVHYVGVSFV